MREAGADADDLPSVAGMKNLRPLHIIAALALVAAVFGLTGCLGMDDYPSRSEVEQSILSSQSANKGAGSMRISSVECVRDAGVKSGSRYRCLIVANSGKHYGSEVVVEPGGRWIMTPGWVADGGLVVQGKADN